MRWAALTSTPESPPQEHSGRWEGLCPTGTPEDAGAESSKVSQSAPPAASGSPDARGPFHGPSDPRPPPQPASGRPPPRRPRGPAARRGGPAARSSGGRPPPGKEPGREERDSAGHSPSAPLAGPSISASATPSAPPQPSGRARGRRDVRTQRGAEADGPRPQARAARGRHVVTLTLPSHAASGMAALAGGKVCQPKLSVGREGWLESRIPALGRRGGVGGRGSP